MRECSGHLAEIATPRLGLSAVGARNDTGGLTLVPF